MSLANSCRNSYLEENTPGRTKCSSEKISEDEFEIGVPLINNLCLDLKSNNVVQAFDFWFLIKCASSRIR